VDGFELLSAGLAELWRWLGSDQVSLAARLALAALFAAAGAHKVRHPFVAATALVNFRVTRRASKAAGALLGWTEVAVAALLLAPVAAVAVAGCAAAGLLSAVYVVVTAKAVHAGERFPCDCLPGLTGEVSRASVARAVAMLIAAVGGAVAPLRGVTYPGDGMLDSVAIAAAGIGVPLAVSVAVTAWRSYRAVLANADWEWILAVRTGRVAVPERRVGGSHD
jgi:uncharacterized membrane protein YphA (DoxX/SURF4 family)